jgi:hypothetical protein
MNLWVVVNFLAAVLNLFAAFYGGFDHRSWFNLIVAFVCAILCFVCWGRKALR